MNVLRAVFLVPCVLRFLPSYLFFIKSRFINLTVHRLAVYSFGKVTVSDHRLNNEVLEHPIRLSVPIPAPPPGPSARPSSPLPVSKVLSSLDPHVITVIDVGAFIS